MDRFQKYMAHPRVLRFMLAFGDQLMEAESSGKHFEWGGTISGQPGKVKRMRSGTHYDLDAEVDSSKSKPL